MSLMAQQIFVVLWILKYQNKRIHMIKVVSEKVTKDRS